MVPGRDRLALVGGGHAHVQVLRSLIMEPLADTEVTLIVDTPVAVYSGMVPGFVAGQYAAHELEIDVRPLARRAGARVVVAPMIDLDAEAKRIVVEGRPPIAYDVASLNVGSTVAGTGTPGVKEHAVPTRPIGDFVRHLDRMFRDPPPAPDDAPYRITVVGAGAGGVELAFCVRQRLLDQGSTDVQVTLLTLHDRPLVGRPERVGARVLAAVRERGIRFEAEVRVVEVRDDAVVLADGRELPSDLVLWVTGAAGSPFLARIGLPVDDRGFLWVRPDLRVRGHDDLFAVGDCAVLEQWPEVPKAGVYAVRQGPRLADNLRRQLRGERLRPYRPQGDYLMLLNLGDGTAIGTKWGLAAESRWLFRWKDHIDQRFMRRFQVLGPHGGPAEAFARSMPPMADVDMVCGGCAAKVGEDALSRALHRLPAAPADPTVAMGLTEADDAVAFERQGELVVSNVDAFTAFTDDPWLVGRVAALNAMSDLYAKGCEPRYAMALVALPEGADPEETLYQVLAGARVALDDAGATLLGGHTTVGDTLTAGFWIAGFAPGPLWSNATAREGDRLVLSRALGTGVLWHADMAGRARGPWIDRMVQGMVRGNGPAAAAARAIGPTAATDVTGFGFAGHLGEMLRGAHLSAAIELERVPALPGALELLTAGERSTFHDQNRQVVRSLRVEPSAWVPALELLFDPQTSGGLLLAVGPDDAEALVARLHAAGDTDAAVVGRVTAPRDDGALFAVG